MHAQNFKKDFPSLALKEHSQDLIYLDSAATSLKPQSVIDALNLFYVSQNAPVHRGVYDRAEIATTQFEQARSKIATFVGANCDELVFTSGTTDSINFVANTWAVDHIGPGDQILVTWAEHHANLLPWLLLAEKRGAQLCYLDIDPKTGLIDSDSFVLSGRVKLVAVSAHSNVLGAIWAPGQLNQLVKAAREVGAKVLIDAAQLVGHVAVNFRQLNADFMVFSGHKMFGPTGIGCLVVKKELHDLVRPYRVGGGMVADVISPKPIWQQSPHKFEAGTPPVAQSIGLAAAVDYFNSNVCFGTLSKNMGMLSSKVRLFIQSLPGAQVFSSDHHFEHIVTFAIDGIHAHDIAAMLGEDGIAVRAGHHCAQPLHAYLKVEATVRLSFHAYNDADDVDKFIESMKKTYRFFKETV